MTGLRSGRMHKTCGINCLPSRPQVLCIMTYWPFKIALLSVGLSTSPSDSGLGRFAEAKHDNVDEVTAYLSGIQLSHVADVLKSKGSAFFHLRGRVSSKLTWCFAGL